MGNGAGTNPYSTQPLSQNVQGEYANALQTANNYAGGAETALGQGNTYGSGAAGIFNQMAGYTPSDVTAGQLSNTNLSPYMNPYTQNVIDTTMGELNRQEGIQQLGIDDQAQRQNAFGGDRWQLQKGQLGGDFARTKATTLADLNSRNFLNAQQMGQYDITNRLNADTTNQGYRANLFGAGGQGLGNLASMYGQTGLNLAQMGSPEVMGNLANMGFGWGNTLQQNQAASGALQQQQQQALIDAIRAQYAGYTGAPQNSLAQYLGAILSPPSSAGSTSSNPGLLGYLGMGAGIGGMFL
jgi:hypothetical protein